MVHDFDTIPISDEKKPRVGIVGEILVKFLPAANNHLADLLEAEGAEPVVPDLIDFICYCFYNQNSRLKAWIQEIQGNHRKSWSQSHRLAEKNSK